MKLVDVNYSFVNINDLTTVTRIYKSSFGYLPHIGKLCDAEVVLHLLQDDNLRIDYVNYKGFTGKTGFFHIPVNSHRYIKSLKPDVVLIQGLLYPIQVFALRFVLGPQAKILVQHHGDKPFTNRIKKFFQKLADRCIDAYLFTAVGNTQPWIEQGVIKSVDKCYEVLEASAFLRKQDKQVSKNRLQLKDEGTMFLWVGRMNADKDPLTVLRGVEKYCAGMQDAKLYMVYQDNNILAEVTRFIDESTILRNCVVLVGKVNHDELQYWFSAADFFISGSYHEAAGYALIECMACGCIPVVTDIPPFKKITNNGQFGLLFQPGNVDSLTKALQHSESVNRQEMSENILRYFSSSLSFKAIADDIYNICQKLINNS
jgi:glycosyltransferase involved in cell wall biosynthesis